jgi:hypothetical protein
MAENKRLHFSLVIIVKKNFLNEFELLKKKIQIILKMEEL